MLTKRAARYDGLAPASPRASRLARSSSAKRDTKAEIVLRKALQAEGVRGYRVDAKGIAGRPDIVFKPISVAVFCDGDFWHGRDLEQRVAKLRRGHNAPYWVEKISGNVARDRRHDAELAAAGWTVLRYWETDVHRDVAPIAAEVKRVVARKRTAAEKPRKRSARK